jgi:hypothetical protein
MRKPPAATAGGGLNFRLLLSLFRQALFPCESWSLIRKAGVGAVLQMTEWKIEPMLQKCMTVIEVQQNPLIRVKRGNETTLLLIFSSDCLCDGRIPEKSVSGCEEFGTEFLIYKGWQTLLIQVCQDEFESFAVRSPANDL